MRRTQTASYTRLAELLTGSKTVSGKPLNDSKHCSMINPT